MVPMKRNLILFFLLCSSLLSSQISEEASISLLTIAHGDQLYNIFGHTAVRVSDPANDIDDVYNYGTFSTSTDHFMLKFLRGRLLYSLDKGPYSSFLRNYSNEGRAVTEQVLNLTPEQKNKVYAFIINNYELENRHYLYDFFFDNCASRVRDIYESQIPVLSYEDQAPSCKTFRQLLDEHLVGLDWLDLGIDLIIGSVADERADPRTEMFLPRYLKSWTAKMQLIGDSGQAEPLVKSERLVLPITIIQHKSYWITPIRLFYFLLLVEMGLFLMRKRISARFSYWYDGIWYVILSAASVIIAFMWFGTDHDACAKNYNLLWANPLFIILTWLHFKHRPAKLLLSILFLFQLSAMLFWPILPQQLHPAVLPILIIIYLKIVKGISYKKQPLMNNV